MNFLVALFTANSWRLIKKNLNDSGILGKCQAGGQGVNNILMISYYELDNAHD